VTRLAFKQFFCQHSSIGGFHATTLLSDRTLGLHLIFIKNIVKRDKEQQSNGDIVTLAISTGKLPAFVLFTAIFTQISTLSNKLRSTLCAYKKEHPQHHLQRCRDPLFLDLCQSLVLRRREETPQATTKPQRYDRRVEQGETRIFKANTYRRRWF
jgi:hypothetical protein